MEENQDLQFGKLVAAKEGEKETEEQLELRLGRRLSRIKSKYKSIFLKDIKDKEIRDIVRRVRAIYKKYDKEKLENENKKEIKEEKTDKRTYYVQKLGNKNMSKMIINLIKTKNATEDQIKQIAEFYGVKLENIKNIKEEREI